MLGASGQTNLNADSESLQNLNNIPNQNFQDPKFNSVSNQIPSGPVGEGLEEEAEGSGDIGSRG